MPRAQYSWTGTVFGHTGYLGDKTVGQTVGLAQLCRALLPLGGSGTWPRPGRPVQGEAQPQGPPTPISRAFSASPALSLVLCPPLCLFTQQDSPNQSGGIFWLCSVAREARRGHPVGVRRRPEHARAPRAQGLLQLTLYEGEGVGGRAATVAPHSCGLSPMAPGAPRLSALATRDSDANR